MSASFTDQESSIDQVKETKNVLQNTLQSTDHLTRVSQIVRGTHADLHVVGMATSGQRVSTLQHGAAERHRVGGLGVQGPDLQRLQTDQNHHQLLPGH